MIRGRTTPGLVLLPALMIGSGVQATPVDSDTAELEALKTEVARERAQLEGQRQRLELLEDRLLSRLRGSASAEQIPAPSPLAGQEPARCARRRHPGSGRHCPA